MTGYKNISTQFKPITERARKVDFRGETPNEEYIGYIEVMSAQDGSIEIHLSRSSLKKYNSNAKWHTQSTYATITAADWDHLLTVERP